MCSAVYLPQINLGLVPCSGDFSESVIFLFFFLPQKSIDLRVPCLAGELQGSSLLATLPSNLNQLEKGGSFCHQVGCARSNRATQTRTHVIEELLNGLDGDSTCPVGEVEARVCRST